MAELISDIITIDNINIFEHKTKVRIDQLKLTHKFIDCDRVTLQNALRNKKNFFLMLLLDSGKAIGFYTTCKIRYNGLKIRGETDYLFSLNLNEKFKLIDNNHYSINDNSLFGFCIGHNEITLYNIHELCYSTFGDKNSHFNNKGITRNEFIGLDNDRLEFFKPKYIEIFEFRNDNCCCCN